MKVGILGGTFDPVHKAHIDLCLSAKNQYQLDQVWLMPAAKPPHKLDRVITGRTHRVEMLRLLANVYPWLKVCEIEFERETPSYTAQTMQILTERCPEHEFYFIIGEDSLRMFHTWYQPEVILQYTSLLVAPRSDSTKDAFEAYVADRAEFYHAGIYPLCKVYSKASSSLVRSVLAEDDFSACLWDSNYPEVWDYLEPCIYRYILAHGLYRSAPALMPLHKALEEKLSPRRYRHSVGVANLAAALAMSYGLDYDKALLAGLLHDCAKELDDAALVQFCLDHELPVSDIERQAGFLLHGRAGAVIAKEYYGVKDTDILSAIEHHVTGRAGMTTLEQIIYIADYIEPGRHMKTDPPLEKIRQLAFRNLGQAVAVISGCIVAHIRSKQKLLDERTLETYEYFSNNNGGLL